MKLGYFGIGSGPCADPRAATRAAQAAEAAGFESVWTGEHVVLPSQQVPPSPVPAEFPMLDPPATLAFLAGVTRTLRLGTGIVILPQRNPVVLAKELASVDVLSGGRLIFGVGVGYLEPEFDAIGVSFRDRGARADEYIDAMRALWTQSAPSFDGRFVSFDGIDAHPRPVQKPAPPVVIGGTSPAALERAVARGNGWYGFALDFERTVASVDGLRAAAKRVERPAELGTLELSVTPALLLDRDVVRRFEDLGVDRLIPLSPARDADGVIRAGNTVVFRIGSDALGTAEAIVEHALDPAIAESGLPAGAASLVATASRAAGWAMFSDSRVGLAVARGSGGAVAQLGAVARQAGLPVSLHGTGGAWIVAAESASASDFAAAVTHSLDRKVCNTLKHGGDRGCSGGGSGAGVPGSAASGGGAAGGFGEASCG